MPRKSDKIPINNPELDRRVKLSDEDKALVRQLREEEDLSYNQLAKRFSVSKRTIIFICKPESLEANKKKRQERGGSKNYYDKDRHKTYMKEHREYKKALYSNDLI